MDPPAQPGGPFMATLTTTLVGSRSGAWLQPPVLFTYHWAVVGPHGQTPALLAKLPAWRTESIELTGTTVHGQVWVAPDENGEWAIQVWQRENGQEKLVAERRLTTDKALSLDTVREGNVPAAEHLVGAVLIDPAQPVAGEPATIAIVMSETPRVRLGSFPVMFVDEDGIHDLGTVLDPGPQQTATLEWTPAHAGSRVLTAFDQTIPVTIVEAAAPPDTSTADTPEIADGDAETP